jgi:hypothetical protein
VLREFMREYVREHDSLSEQTRSHKNELRGPNGD